MTGLTSTRSATARWFPLRAVAPTTGRQLFCLPPAAGAASRFRPWITALAPRIDVVPVQLPGREGRFTEDPITSASEMVTRLTDAVLAHAGQDFALFGHSMGAVLAYELADALAGRGRPPTHLVVSGHVPAHLVHLKPHRTTVDRMSDQRLRAYLADNGGVEADVFADTELMDILLPLLRADLTLCESYRWAPRPPLTTPITALGGDADPNVPAALLGRWAELTVGGFRMSLLPGGHHYLYQQVTAMTGLVAEALSGGGR